MSRTAGPDPEPTSGVDRLLRWFAGRDRDVPWREEEDAYRIWVAEVMAQQTRIGTVRDYYGPFLARFPDVESLAAADLQDVLKAWEGLGYYARARNLHRAAGEVVARYGGEIPSEPEALSSLPGVGPYTAGAVASMAFGVAAPAVDGNARRVLSRLFDLEAPGAAALREAALRLLEAAPPGSCAEVNQGLMDLGGEICTPRDPACGRCPLRDSCLALDRGTVALRPPPRRRTSSPHHDVAVGLVWDARDRVLISRRPPEGLLGGLWEFPGGKIEEGESGPEALVREIREELGIGIDVLSGLDPIRHAYSHFRVTLHPYHARHRTGRVRALEVDDWKWEEPGRLSDYPFPAANQPLIEAARAGL